MSLGMISPPVELGSGKFGTPCARMHYASLSSGPPLASACGVFEDPQATTAAAQSNAADAPTTLRGCDTKRALRFFRTRVVVLLSGQQRRNGGRARVMVGTTESCLTVAHKQPLARRRDFPFVAPAATGPRPPLRVLAGPDQRSRPRVLRTSGARSFVRRPVSCWRPSNHFWREVQAGSPTLRDPRCTPRRMRSARQDPSGRRRPPVRRRRMSWPGPRRRDR
jgi:hypothetical protein